MAPSIKVLLVVRDEGLRTLLIHYLQSEAKTLKLEVEAIETANLNQAREKMAKADIAVAEWKLGDARDATNDFVTGELECDYFRWTNAPGNVEDAQGLGVFPKTGCNFPAMAREILGAGRDNAEAE